MPSFSPPKWRRHIGTSPGSSVLHPTGSDQTIGAGWMTFVRRSSPPVCQISPEHLWQMTALKIGFLHVVS